MQRLAVDDAARPLKKYVAERAAECLQATHLLAKDLSRSSRPEAVAAMHQGLAAKAEAITKTRQLLQQVPKLLAALEENLESGIQRAAPLAATEDTLRKAKQSRSVRSAAAMESAQGPPEAVP